MYISTNQAKVLQEENRSFYGSYEDNSLKDVTSHNYTKYLEDHYAELALKAERQPYVDPTKVGDILNDMWISFHLREMQGKDFSEDYVNRAGDQVEIDSAVLNTLIQYAKNKKYHLRFNYKEKAPRGLGDENGEFEFIPVTSANHKSDDKSASVEYSALAQASTLVGGFNPTDDTIYEKLTHDLEIKEALEYSLVSTEGFQYSLRTILDNVDMLLNKVKGNRATVADPDKTGLLKAIHGAMFNEYDSDIELERCFRVIFSELRENRDNLMNIYNSVCDNLYSAIA